MGSNEVFWDYKKYILGGYAEFTLQQQATEKRGEVQMRYLIKQPKMGGKNVWYVYTETTDSKKLEYHGFLKVIGEGNNAEIKFNRKDIQNYNESAIKALLWVLCHNGSLPSVVHIYHNGRCSVCGRKLKDAESLKYGIGPTCREKVGIV